VNTISQLVGEFANGILRPASRLREGNPGWHLDAQISRWRPMHIRIFQKCEECSFIVHVSDQRAKWQASPAKNSRGVTQMGTIAVHVDFPAGDGMLEPSVTLRLDHRSKQQEGRFRGRSSVDPGKAQALPGLVERPEYHNAVDGDERTRTSDVRFRNSSQPAPQAPPASITSVKTVKSSTETWQHRWSSSGVAVKLLSGEGSVEHNREKYPFYLYLREHLLCAVVWRGMLKRNRLPAMPA
jgi:hypothetical protein